MNERAISFGESGALFGILGAPEIPDPSRPAVLIPNTGVMHRVGPSRMHVELARALAAAGVVSLRIDHAGLGDSEPVPGRSDTTTRELSAAMDALDARNISSGYVVIGSHSGAHDAHQAARIDPRIVDWEAGLVSTQTEQLLVTSDGARNEQCWHQTIPWPK